MNRIDRLFGILTLLQSRRYVSGDTIAEKFTISIRTVYRDIRALCEQGIPVSFEPNKGYYVVQGYFLPPVSFSSEEAGALLLMENLIAGFADQSIARHYSNALNKVRSVLRTQQKEKLESLTNAIRYQIPQRIVNNTEYLTLLQEAITSRHIVDLEYAKENGEKSVRRVEPVGLIFYAFSWHVMSWCHLRQDYRDFRVSRITGLRNTGLSFAKTDHRPLSEFMSELPVDY